MQISEYVFFFPLPVIYSSINFLSLEGNMERRKLIMMPDTDSFDERWYHGQAADPLQTYNRELGDPDVLPSVHDDVAMWGEMLKKLKAKIHSKRTRSVNLNES